MENSKENMYFYTRSKKVKAGLHFKIIPIKLTKIKKSNFDFLNNNNNDKAWKHVAQLFYFSCSDPLLLFKLMYLFLFAGVVAI